MHRLCFALLLPLLFHPARALGAEPPADPGEALYAARCSNCHADGAAQKAPPLATLRQMPAERVFFSLSNGVMKAQAAGLTFPEIGAIVAYASAGTRPDYTPDAAALCTDRSIDLERPVVAKWGFDSSSSGALGAAATSIDASNVGTLKLVWAFGLPGTTDTRSMPVATRDTLFVAAAGGHVFALDRATGCVKWHRATPVRTSLTLGTLGGAGARHALFFGDMQGFVTALDAATGEITWRERVGLFDASMLTGAIAQHGSTLYVPVSSIEVGLAANPAHECCRSHGAVRALDATNGAVLWTHRMTPDAAPMATNSAGVMQWGPSGAPVWSAPTVDAARGVLYVGTGENYSSPATDRSDAIVALDLATGAEKWHFQARVGDVYNMACDGFPPGPNCPSERGPDFDFGAAVIVTQDSRGRSLLLAGQKSGDVWALDPDDAGRVVWNRRLGAGSKLGGVHWGIAVSDGRVYVPIADPPFPIPGYVPRPGVYALSVDDGRVLWEHPIERGCETDLIAYFQRDRLYPECSFWFGPSNAPLALPGVLVVGALDGQLRALSTQDGGELWRFATLRPYESVNGVPAHGGSIDAAPAIAVGNTLYVQSGYGLFGHLPGNALLAFALP